MLSGLIPKNSLDFKLLVSQILLSALLFILDPELWVSIVITIYTMLDELFF